MIITLYIKNQNFILKTLINKFNFYFFQLVINLLKIKMSIEVDLEICSDSELSCDDTEYDEY